MEQLFAFFDCNGVIVSVCEGVDNAASEERYLVSLGLPFELTSYVAPTMEDAWQLFGAHGHWRCQMRRDVKAA